MSVLLATLLDLTLLRAASRLRFISAARCCRRRLQSHALSNPPPPYSFNDHNVLLSQISRKQSAPLSELEKRVQALEEAAEKESSVLEPPSYSEEELTGFYDDLLSISPSQQEQELGMDTSDITVTSTEQDLAVLGAIERRLLGSFPQTDEFEEGSSLNSDAAIDDNTQLHQRLLLHLQNIVTRLEGVQDSVSPQNRVESGASFVPLRQFFPISVISVKECEALVRICLRERDHVAAEKTLSLMKRIGMPLPTDSITSVLRLYANSGDVANFERAMSQYLTDAPTDQQRHLHVKAHLHATAPNTIPSTALQVLHNYELQSHPAPMQTYTSVIASLFSHPSSLSRAQALDLFSHMRYVAHPQPDTLLYTLIIRACASPISSSRTSEPERALDLWTEMTVDHRMTPTAGAYNAVILACAKSGLRRYVNEAFRLAKEMLDTHRDAKGRTAFRPDRKTFCALLEGAKRIGDLSRARWILAELVRGVAPDGYAFDDASDMTVNEEVMMHVFHAYAAYKPPFVRSLAPTAKSETQSPNNGEADAVESSPPATQDLHPAFTHIPPQSRQEVIHEASVLFHRIIADTQPQPDHDHSHPEELPMEPKFQHVTLTTRLLNSYISVFYRHSTLETAQDMFWKLYDEYGVHRSARTYVEALERCSRAEKGRERQIAHQFAQELWSKWEMMENRDQSLSPRLVERAHIAFIRTLALVGDLDKAMTHLREFVAKYPPQAVRQPTPIPDLRSTRTSLVGARPLVRLTSNADVPDDHVPPFLTFADVDILHHRLISSERKSAWEQIGYIKWVCKAYEWALRGRKHEAHKARVKADGDIMDS